MIVNTMSNENDTTVLVAGGAGFIGYSGYYIYCGGNSMALDAPLYYSIYGTSYGSLICMNNGSYSLFKFLANNTCVEYGYFCHTDSDNTLSDTTPGFVVTSGDEREGYLGYPSESNYNTQIHSHPKSDGANGGKTSEEDKKYKEQAQSEGSQITNYAVYNPCNGEIRYY